MHSAHTKKKGVGGCVEGEQAKLGKGGAKESQVTVGESRAVSHRRGGEPERHQITSMLNYLCSLQGNDS